MTTDIINKDQQIENFKSELIFGQNELRELKLHNSKLTEEISNHKNSILLLNREKRDLKFQADD